MEISHNLIPIASLFFFFTFTSFSKADDGLYSEALLSFKSNLTDDYDTLADWSPETPTCSWSGVTCDANSTTLLSLDLSAKSLRGTISGEHFKLFSGLVSLNLSFNSFSGDFPAGIFSLAGLQSLDISRNNFSGRFPGGISKLRRLSVLDAFSNSFSGELPPEISKLDGLEILNFAGSYFRGEIPAEYGSLKRIKFIHLAGNFLGGEIPAELGKLKTLTHMEIGYNSYTGEIPREFGNMSNLRYLDIAGANLSGEIPRELGNLTSLESLFLFRNRLAGPVPKELAGASSLVSLDLSDNFLTGSIPASLSELKSLKLLSVMRNGMSGEVPEEIGDLPSLETLMIWDNEFQGELPRGLGRSSRLLWLDASTNGFDGTVPSGICDNGGLEKLMLFSNRFSGDLSMSLSNCSSLVRVRLENNSFSGGIPFRFDRHGKIEYVDLSGNDFTGGIPIDFPRLSRIEYFNVSNNPRLGGSVPSEEWVSPNKLRNFSASSCGISGEIPSFRGCNSLSVIELHSNNLSGLIPDELADLPRLSIVDFSMNLLTGEIPSKLGRSSSLRLLNVSSNDISGSIPSGKLFRSMDRSAFLGNPRLCGALVRRCSRGSFWIVVLAAISAAILIGILASALIFLRRASNKQQWKMISFTGLPHFTANDVLKSFDSGESTSKAVLPTGITVSVKKIEFTESSKIEPLARAIGKARHENLARLLGICHNNHTAYLLYDYFPNGSLAEKLGIEREWPVKYGIAVGIARGLRFLHHDCSPTIPHGDLTSRNVVFDENMETRLTEFGIKSLQESDRETDELSCNAMKEAIYTDIYSFGEILLEILTDGRLTNAQNKRREDLLNEIVAENKVSLKSSVQEEVKLVLDIALLCTKTRPIDRPSMEEALKLISVSQSQRK